MTLLKLILATNNDFACMEQIQEAKNEFRARYRAPLTGMNLDRRNQVVACILIL